MIRIANWNLNHSIGVWRQTAICEKLRDIEADILILTETRDSISPGGGLECIAQSSHSAELGNDESWVSIWSRLRKVADHATADAEFTASATVVLPDGTPLVVFGTVLPWLGRGWRTYPAARAVAFKEALRVQRQDWQTLAAEQGAALCVAGDFNQDLSCTHYYQSRRARRLLRASLARCDLVATTSELKDPVLGMTNGAEACIDHICLSSTLARRQIGRSHAWSPIINGRVVSDHPGVWVKLADAPTK